MLHRQHAAHRDRRRGPNGFSRAVMIWRRQQGDGRSTRKEPAMMRLRLLALIFAALPAAAGAQAPDWAHAQRVEVQLSNFAFTPSTLHLRAGRPVILHLVNSGSGGHDFTAPKFFAAAQMRPQDRA